MLQIVLAFTLLAAAPGRPRLSETIRGHWKIDVDLATRKLHGFPQYVQGDAATRATIDGGLLHTLSLLIIEINPEVLKGLAGTQPYTVKSETDHEVVLHVTEPAPGGDVTFERIDDNTMRLKSEVDDPLPVLLHRDLVWTARQALPRATAQQRARWLQRMSGPWQVDLGSVILDSMHESPAWAAASEQERARQDAIGRRVFAAEEPDLVELLNASYASWFNRRHGRINSLFGERYKAILIEKQAYLQRVVRYVVLNPVRAKMVARPEEYAWSSYRATAGLAEAQPWLCVEQLVPFFGESDTWRANYIAFVNEKCAAEEQIWTELRRRFFLSSEEWLKKLKKIIRGKLRHDDHPAVQRLAGAPSVHAIATEVAKEFGMSVQDLRAMRGGAARMMTAWIAWYEGSHRLRKIAAVLRLRSQGHISGLIRAAEQEIAGRPELQRRLGLVYIALE